MSKIALKVENLSKQYRLGVIGTGTLSHDLNRWWHRVRGKNDPYLRVGEINNREDKGSSDYVWALKDINFEVRQGEILGIIGKNGAGKSTLLKILSKVTGPTTGTIKAKGRIASLLEVGTGFHPELTGRENIFLNGALLGMTKKEIVKKLDAIIDFAGVERYVDTPVKRYSSGMRVRLGFAVAAFLEPEILVVDEVLAVGDAEFQRRAIGKMQDVSKEDGRTVLFVSHNMASIKQLCPKSVLLSQGRFIQMGNSEDIINEYLNINNYVHEEKDLSKITNRKGAGNIIITKISLYENESPVRVVKMGARIKIKIEYRSEELSITFPRILIGVYNKMSEGIIRFDSNATAINLNKIPGNGEIICEIMDVINLIPGNYFMNIAFSSKGIMEDYLQHATVFEIVDNNYLGKGKSIQGEHLAKVILKHSWNIGKNK